MARPGSQQQQQQSRSRRRSSYSATYLTRVQLAAAPDLMAVQLSKAQSRDISGEQWEELWAEIVDGVVTPGRSNRPVPDGYRDGVAYSLKTRALKPVASRPEPLDWIGQEIPFQIARLQPSGALPRGRTLLDASPAAIGRRLITAHNEMLESYGWERQGFLGRLHCAADEQWAYLYWETTAPPLDATQITWSEGRADLNGNGSSGWSRSIHGRYRHAKGRRARGADRPADLTWTSAGQLSIRHQIPEDVDLFVVPDAKILSRQEATAAVLGAINVRLLGQ